MSFKDGLFFLLLGAIGIAIPAAVVWIHFVGADPNSGLFSRPWSTAIGAVVLTLAAGTCYLNLYTSFIRPWLHFRRFGHMDSYRHVSGAPFVGGLLVFGAAVMLPPYWAIGAILLLIYALDTGGIHWLFYAVLRNGLSGPAARDRAEDQSSR